MKKKNEIVIDAFKAGDYPQGKFGAKELSEIESTYNPENYEAPILIGHLSDPSYKGKSAIPAFGWIGKVKVVGDHLKLVASQFSEELKEFIKKGFYKKVSAAFYEPTDKSNPTPGKWHLHHLAFLGGTPPAVKGLEQIAFAEMKGIGIEFAEVDASIEIDGVAIETVEEIATEDTIKDLTESCATFIAKVEDAMNADIDMETCKSRCQLAASDLSGEIYNCLSMHWMFKEKLENVEEHNEMEMSEKKSWLIELAEKVHLIKTKRKETIVDTQKEKQYTDKIGELETKLKEFTDKETAAQAAQVEADKKAADSALLAKDEALKTEIKTFCDTAITGNKMTPAMREKDEPIMFTLGKTSSEALKAFQEKYSVAIVPEGETKIVEQNLKVDSRPLVIRQAEAYAKAHKTEKEFAELSEADATSRALYLHSLDSRKYKFEDITITKGAK